MPGGLIQIASYGQQDIFLISNPQITFFKTIFKRHTNFSMEYNNEQFNGIVDFGNSFSCTISKIGDLVHKMYLKIQLPEITTTNLPYNNMNNNEKLILENIIKNLYLDYNNFKNFINIVKNIHVDIIKQNNIYGSYIQDINLLIEKLKNKYLYQNALQKYILNIILVINKNQIFYNVIRNDIKNNNDNIKLIDYLDFCYLLLLNIKDIPSNLLVNNINIFLSNYINQIKIIDNLYLEKINFYKNLLNYKNRKLLSFSWVYDIGHQIIKKIEIEIGGKVIDFVDKYSLHIYKFKNIEKSKLELYNKMIGNIDLLTNFDYNGKPSYTLILPLNFWFNNFSGCSIPIIFLRYHDIKINVELENIGKCIYYENNNSQTIIDDYINNLHIIDASLIVKYIYVDTEERNKFGQLTHEYILDQTQNLNYFNILTSDFVTELTFYNAVKNIDWIITDTHNEIFNKELDFSNNIYINIISFEDVSINNLYLINNLNNTNYKYLLKINTPINNLSELLKINDNIKINKTIFYKKNYKIIFIESNYFYINELFNDNEEYCFFNTNFDNIYINKVLLQMNGVNRIQKTDGIYHNLIQPYQYYPFSNPSYNISSYSFALYPTQFNPSGFFNFDEIKISTLSININNFKIKKNNILNNIIHNNYSLTLRIYCTSYNILRFINGKANLVYNI